LHDRYGGDRGSGLALSDAHDRDHGRRLPRSIVTFTICVPEPS